MMEVFFWLNVRRHNPIPRANIVARSMFGFQAKIRFFEPLIKFLAILVQTLCQKYSNYVRNFQGLSGDFPY